MATAVNVSSGMVHARRLVISAPWPSVVSVGWRVLSSQGEKDGKRYWVSADLLLPSLRLHEQTLASVKLRSKTCT